MLMFECLCGYPPFDGETVQEVFQVLVFEGVRVFSKNAHFLFLQQIFVGAINWPVDCEISPWCKDLLSKLIEADPEKRLHDAVKVKVKHWSRLVSSLCVDKELQAHPWFLDGDPDFWLTLSSFDPPYIPDRASEEDTSAFNERNEYFPVKDDVEKVAGSEIAELSDDDSSSDYETPEMPRKDVQDSFWHVSVQNLGLLNKKEKNAL